MKSEPGSPAWLSDGAGGAWPSSPAGHRLPRCPPVLTLRVSRNAGGFRHRTEGKAAAGHFPCRAQGSPPSALQEKGGWSPQDQGNRGPGSGGALTHHFGLEGRLDLPVLQLLPVDPPEEGVFAHVPLALGPAAQPLARVLGHQLEGGREDLMRKVRLQLIRTCRTTETRQRRRIECSPSKGEKSGSSQ